VVGATEEAVSALGWIAVGYVLCLVSITVALWAGARFRKMNDDYDAAMAAAYEERRGGAA